MRPHRRTYRPQGFDPDVEAWRFVFAVAFFVAYCAVRSMFER